VGGVDVRVLMISDVSFPRVNGVSTSIATFRHSLAELGHETTLIAPAYDVPHDDGADIVRIPSRAVPLDREDRLMSARAVRRLEARFKADEYDVVHIHTPFIAHYTGVALARRLGIPVVETYHTFFEEYFHHYAAFLPSWMTRRVARSMTVSQCRAVDALVVPSPQMLAKLREYGVATRAEVLPTGIDPQRFCGGDGERFRATHGIAANRPMMVHISRVAHEKNIDFILHMVTHVVRAVPDALLVIAGEGPAQGHLKALVQRLNLCQHVQFVGYLDRSSTLLDCYRAADVFVFASRTETQGLVLLESLALGTPVVSTAVMGTADVLKDAKGAVVVPEDAQVFAAAVVRVLREPHLRQQLSEFAPTDASAWSAKAMAERLASLYGSLWARDSI
jgi:1,2-diacylglycerol 3-alpha-glucosyltransferase